MKNRFFSVLLLCSITLAACFAPLGCSLFQGATSTPALFDSARPIQDRIVSGERIYTAVLKELTLLRKQKLIDDDEQRTIADLRKKASVAFDSAHLLADAGDSGGASAQLDQIQNLINQLAAMASGAQLKKSGDPPAMELLSR